MLVNLVLFFCHQNTKALNPTKTITYALKNLVGFGVFGALVAILGEVRCSEFVNLYQDY